MATSSPFSLLNDLCFSNKLTSLQPPAWAVDEAQHRLVLLLNHVLMQEPEATARLATAQRARRSRPMANLVDDTWLPHLLVC